MSKMVNVDELERLARSAEDALDAEVARVRHSGPTVGQFARMVAHVPDELRAMYAALPPVNVLELVERLRVAEAIVRDLAHVQPDVAALWRIWERARQAFGLALVSMPTPNPKGAP
jgi:hypothetical protein